MHINVIDQSWPERVEVHVSTSTIPDSVYQERAHYDAIAILLNDPNVSEDFKMALRVQENPERYLDPPERDYGV